MIEEAEAKGRKRPVVQLTALLDLLFIMIFIGLLTPHVESDSGPSPQVTPNNEGSKAQARRQLLEEASELEGAAGRLGLGNHLRKLFTANMYYRISGDRREYRETALWAADIEGGLVRFRLKLAAGTSIVKTNVGEPLTLAEGEPVSDCSGIRLTRESIYQRCKMPFARTLTIDCRLQGMARYQCDETLSQESSGRNVDWRWEYELELISAYDERFAG